MSAIRIRNNVFSDILQHEMDMRPFKPYTDILHMRAPHKEVLDFYNIAWQILEVAKSSLVSRSYNYSYSLTRENTVWESVGAHTNLVLAIMDYALWYVYGSNSFHHTIDMYSYRHIVEAIRLHDLAENETGDEADNGERNEEEKNRIEMEYFKIFTNRYPSTDPNLKNKVLDLLKEMQDKSSPTGKLIYLSDKVSADIITLCLDRENHPPMIRKDSPFVSKRDLEEIALCDFVTDLGYYRASEMWATDFFEVRKLNQYDETFFFTALIVMATLMVHGKWYEWREKSYQ